MLNSFFNILSSTIMATYQDNIIVVICIGANKHRLEAATDTTVEELITMVNVAYSNLEQV